MTGRDEPSEAYRLHELGVRYYVLGIALMHTAAARSDRTPIIPGRVRRYPPAFNPAWLSAAAKAVHQQP